MKKQFPLLTIWISLIFFIFITSCDNEDRHNKEMTVTIASEKSLYTGGEMYAPYFAKIEGETQWTSLEGISGFDFEEGYEYVLRIWREKWHDGEIQDASIYRYKLLEVISRDKKDSENLPVQRFFIHIGPQKVANPTPESTYYVRWNEAGKWNTFPDIEEFDFQAGYEYILLIDRVFNDVGLHPRISYIYVSTYQKTKEKAHRIKD